MFRLLGRYLKHHIPEIIINLLFVGLQVYVQTFIIMKDMKNIIDQGVANADMDYIKSTSIRMAIFTVVAILCTVVTSYVSARIVAGVVCEARRDCIQKVYSLLPQDVSKFGGSSLLTRIMSDMIQVQTLVINLCRSSLMVPFIIVSMLILIFMMNPLLALILLVAFVITIVIMIMMGAKSKPYFEQVQENTDHINLLVKEKLTGARTIRAYGNQDFEEEKMEKANKAVFDTNIEANKRINFLSPISLIIMNWTVVIIYLIGTEQIKQKITSVSDLLLIFSYLTYFIASLAVVPVMVNLIPKVSVSSQRILEILDYVSEEEKQSENVKNRIKKDSVGKISRGDIEFQNVIFGYTGAVQVIADLTFHAKAGKTTAIIGATGSGKTTLLNLLQGLYRMNFGDILIDGVSIRDMDSDYLRKNISYATQKAMIFHDTVRANVSCYDETVSEERIRHALDLSCFSEVVQNMPEGIDTKMAQNGMNVSGGQRQRLSLARAFAKDAAIYLFDDTLSALDAETEQKVRHAIQTELADKTVIIVSQKISNVRDADKIIVLEKGRVAGEGTHKDLLETCQEYQEIYRIQCHTEEEK